MAQWVMMVPCCARPNYLFAVKLSFTEKTRGLASGLFVSGAVVVALDGGGAAGGYAASQSSCPRFSAKAIKLFLRGRSVEPVARFGKAFLEAQLKLKRTPSKKLAGSR